MTTDTLIQDLLHPDSLPDPTERVALVQTHISMVFVADNCVYKVKKPVNFGFLDFTTLEKRKYFCHQEVLLNKRLAPDVYLGVLPVTYDGKTFRIASSDGDGGHVVDYAVHMRKIPADHLMIALLQRGELTENHMHAVARTLADFHLRAEQRPEIDRFGRPEAFKVNTDENFEQTRKFIGVTLSRETFDTIEGWTGDFFREREDLFLERIHAKKVRDCHGDLHMEHVCFTDPLAIIDCIEFNERFRYGDTLADIAFLLMDMEYHGASSLARVLWERYGALTGDGDMVDLLVFYKVYRAYVRGKVIGFRLDDSGIDQAEKNEATEAASKYFNLARSYIP